MIDHFNKHIFDNKDIYTLIIASLSFVLGVYNFIHERKKEKIILKVRPKLSNIIRNENSGRSFIKTYDEFDSNLSYDYLSIEVINLSKFPVTISNMGFQTNSAKRVIIPDPIFGDKGNLPMRIESRTSATGLCYLNIIGSEKIKMITKAFVETECGNLFYGDSKILKDIGKHYKSFKQ